jgi:hypothetical protein
MKAFKSFVLVVCVCLILNGNVASAVSVFKNIDDIGNGVLPIAINKSASLYNGH